MSKAKAYDVFVSYCEDTGESFAEAIKKAFARRNLNTFVSGLDKPYIEGKWEEFIDNVIHECQIFVLLLTIDTLESQQVQRELNQLKLKGINSKNFWIVRHNIPEVPRNNEILNNILAFDISDFIQADFKDETCLITSLLRHFDGAYVKETTIAPPVLTVDLIKSNYVILDPTTKFSSGDISCWKTGSFTFDDIHGDYDAQRPIIEKIDKALENNSIILFGPPHSGKSMILKRLAIRKVKENYHVIYIEDWKDDSVALVKLVQSATLNKLKLFIIIDNIHNSVEALRAFNNCHGVKFLFGGIKQRMDLTKQEYHSREDIKELKRALSNLQNIELQFSPQDALALWVQANFLLGRRPIDEENGNISIDLTLPMEGLNYYTLSQSDMLIFFAYIKSHLFEGKAGHVSVDILENDFIQKWNGLNDLKLHRAAIFSSFMSIFGIKITHQIVTKCKLNIEDLIQLVKKDFLVMDSAGNFYIAHEKWASEFLAYIYKNFYLENEDTNRFDLSIKDVIQCVFNCLDLNDLFQAFNSCVYLYYNERYRHLVDTVMKVSRLASFGNLTKEDRMKILADAVGGFYFDTGDYQKAIHVNEEAIQVYPSSPIPWYNKGIALDNLLNYDESINSYNEAIKLDEKYAKAWAGRGISLRNKGPEYYSKAHDSFNKALGYDPNNVKAWEHQGITYRWQSRYKDALACYKKALESDEFSDRIWYDIGVLYSSWGKYKKALDAYNKATDLNDNNYDAWSNKAIVQEKLGKFEDALHSVYNLLDVYSDAPDLWRFKARIEKKLGKNEDCNNSLRRAEELSKFTGKPFRET